MSCSRTLSVVLLSVLTGARHGALGANETGLRNEFCFMASVATSFWHVLWSWTFFLFFFFSFNFATLNQSMTVNFLCLQLLNFFLFIYFLNSINGQTGANWCFTLEHLLTEASIALDHWPFSFFFFCSCLILLKRINCAGIIWVACDEVESCMWNLFCLISSRAANRCGSSASLRLSSFL